MYKLEIMKRMFILDSKNIKQISKLFTCTMVMNVIYKYIAKCRVRWYADTHWNIH